MLSHNSHNNEQVTQIHNAIEYCEKKIIRNSIHTSCFFLLQNGEGELETDRESNGHHKTDSEYSDERNLQDLKEKVSILENPLRSHVEKVKEVPASQV